MINYFYRGDIVSNKGMKIATWVLLGIMLLGLVASLVLYLI